MKRVISVVLSLLVAASVLSAAVPAQAGAGDSKSCVTTREYKAVKKRQAKQVVTYLLDGRGKAKTSKTRHYSKCNSRARVVITYTKRFKSASAKVKSKKLVHPKSPGSGPGSGQPADPPPAGGASTYPPASTYRCPSHAPIKGNEPSMIYHPPASPWYAETTPEKCFSSEAGARAAGFRRAKY